MEKKGLLSFIEQSILTPILVALLTTLSCALSKPARAAPIEQTKTKVSGLTWFPLGISIGLSNAWYPNTFSDVSENLAGIQNSALGIHFDWNTYFRPPGSSNLLGLNFDLGGDFPGGLIRTYGGPALSFRRYFGVYPKPRWFFRVDSGWHFVRGGDLSSQGPNVVRRGPLLRFGVGYLGEQFSYEGDDGFGGSSTDLDLGVQFLNYGPSYFVILSWGFLASGR